MARFFFTKIRTGRMKEIIIDRSTTGIAFAGITSPGWLTMLEQASSIAALFMPVLGAIWLALRIWDWWFPGATTPKE